MAIGKVNANGGDIGGLIRYVFSAEDHKQEVRDEVRQIAGTMSARTKSALREEFEAIQSLRPNLTKNTLHWSVSFPKDEVPDRQTMGKIAELVCERMGVQAYIAVSHGDHFHIAGSRVNTDGSVVSDSNSYKRLEAVMREVERTFGLREVRSSHLHDDGREIDHRRSLDVQELSMHERRGTVPAQMTLQQIIDDVLSRKTPISASEFIEALELAGVDVRPNIASTGKLSGFSYGYEGRAYTSKELGKAYKLSNLQQKGLSYEPLRDAENCRAAAERSAEKRAQRHARSTEGAAAGLAERASDAADFDRADVRRDLEDTGSFSERHSSARESDQRSDHEVRRAREEASRDDRSSAEVVESDNREHESGARDGAESDALASSRSEQSSLRTAAAAPRVDAGSEGVTGESTDVSAPDAAPGRRPGPGSGGGSVSSAAVSDASGSDNLASIDGDDWNALTRFFRQWEAQARKARGKNSLAKAFAAPTGRIGAPARLGQNPGAAYDELMMIAGAGRYAQTERAIAAQVAAFGVPYFEVQGIPPRDSDIEKPTKIHTLSAEQVLRYRAYLGAQNVRGLDIYIRPKSEADKDGNTWVHPYIFVDDLNRKQLDKLKQHGLELAIEVQSSPGNFHGWIRVADDMIAPELATKAAQLVAKAIGGDPGAADWRHYGRLAGFTNQKPSRRRSNGHAPFVTMTAKPGHESCSNGQALLDAAQQQLARESAELAAAAARRTAAPAAPQSRPGGPATALEAVEEALPRLNKGDASATDFAVAMSALRHGFDAEEVKEALRQRSPDLAKRKGRNVDAYLDRTLEKAQEKVGNVAPRMR